MLAIRMQRTGRKGHAMFRIVVQDSRRTPSSGRVVAQLGHYDPHTKTIVVDKERAQKYITNGAQPSNRVAMLIKKEGVKLPDWFSFNDPLTRTTRNAEKLRKNQPEEPKVEKVEVTEDVAPEAVTDEPVAETTEEVTAEETPEVETPADEEPKAETSEEKPAKEEADEAKA